MVVSVNVCLQFDVLVDPKRFLFTHLFFSAFSEHLNHKLSSEEVEFLPKGKWKFKWESPAFDMPNCRWKGTRENFLDVCVL